MNQLRQLQLSELDILIEFDKVCRKNGLIYYLDSGSLLGAVRHSGFIPWDNDIDISMPIRDYWKFCIIAKKQLNDRFFLQNYKTDLCNWMFAKIRMNNTTCIEKGWESKNIHQGVWIDIFPIIGVNPKNSKRYFKIQSSLKKALKFKIDSYNASFNSSGKRKIIKIIPYSIVRLFVSIVCRIIFKNHYKCDYCIPLYPSYNFENVVPSYYFSSPIELFFEGHKFFAPRDYDKYLTFLYNDYMIIPPEENRNTGDHTIFLVDLENNYTKYIRK